MQKLGWLFTENQSFQKKILESVREGKLSSGLIVSNPELLRPERVPSPGAISCPRKPLPHRTLPGNDHSVNACTFPVMFASAQMFY